MAWSRRTIRALVGVLMVGLFSTACAPGNAGDGGVEVVATTSMLGDIVSNLLAGDGSVEVVMPVGADPHSFSPSSRQVASMNDADLVVANGLGLEESFEEVLDGVAADGGQLLEVGPGVDPLPFGGPGEGGDDDDHSLDPHIWMDPIRMATAAHLVAESLAALDPSIDWEGRADAYALELQTAHAEIEDLLSEIPAERRVMITNHDSLGYFADRYDVEVVGTVVPGGSTLADPSSEELAALVAVMRERGIDVIFAETTRPATLAAAVASELGGDVSVVELYTGSLGEPGTEAGTLIGMLIANARLIADALGADG